MKFNNSGSGRQGFTLIELLTVIAVIALLASLLFPGVVNALAKARTARCQGNLRQIGAAMTLYAAAHDMELPRYQTTVSSRHYWWGYYAVGLERALAEQLGSDQPADTNKATGNAVFICPASSLRWDRGISRYRARGVECDNNTYEGLYYNYKMSTLNVTSGDTDAGAVPAITKFSWYTSPARMPFQWCSIRLTVDPEMTARYTVNTLGARSWHSEQERPMLFLDGHVKILVRPEYTQHGSQAVLNPKVPPNINYNPRHVEFQPGSPVQWANGGDFATAEF